MAFTAHPVDFWAFASSPPIELMKSYQNATETPVGFQKLEICKLIIIK